MRSEYELLKLLKEYYLESSEHSMWGLCDTIQLMKYHSIISYYEWELLSLIIRENPPTNWLSKWYQFWCGPDWFFIPGKRFPRVIWLNKMIKYHT